MKTKILIEVRGGNIVNICSNQDIDIVVVDYDNAACGDEPVSGIHSPDSITEDIATLFSDSDPLTQEIHDELRRLHF